LLIYDNVEESDLLERYLPSTAGPIIITTRYSDVAFKAGGINKAVELLPFHEDESKIVFAALRKKYRQDTLPFNPSSADKETAIVELMEILGGLAVGIEHMAAYIECDKLTVCEFLDKYKRMTVEVHKRGNTGTNAPHTLDTLWAMAFKQLRDKNLGAFHLLCMLSVISPDGIPLSIFNLEDEEDEEEIVSGVIMPYSSFCTDYEE
jgi:hypothetical protein